MRIDPKPFTLCILDRTVILSGLELKLTAMRAKVARLRTSSKDNALASLQRAEMTVARIEDLIKTLES